MERSFEILVVGAGPAGSAAAITALAQAPGGLRVGLLDKAEFPRDKLCGGLFTGRARRALGAVFDTTPPAPLFLPCDHMRFGASGRVLSEFRNAPLLHLTMRRQMDSWLRDMAITAGAAAITGQFHSLDEASSRLYLRDGSVLRYGVLIGADGVNSALARALFGRAFDPDTIGFGLELEAPRPAFEPHDMAVEIDFDAVRWGYGWSFPKAEITTIGVGGVNARNADMKRCMAQYETQLGLKPGCARLKGQYLPFGDFRRKPGRGAVILVGDAAGLVDPITGEGIALAIESGALGARAARRALQDGHPERTARSYTRDLRPIHAGLRQAGMWRRLIFSDLLRPAFLAAFSGSRLPVRFLHLLAGELDYDDLRAELLRKAPKALLHAAMSRLR